MGWMWTKEHRKRQAAFERRRYPSDLTDAEWERIKPLLPEPARRGRKPKVDLREILNAIRSLGRAGCSWRMLPIDFGVASYAEINGLRYAALAFANWRTGRRLYCTGVSL
jgi:transposase